MKTMVATYFLAVSILCCGCSSTSSYFFNGSIQSRWDYPPQAKLRLMNLGSSEIQEFVLPIEMNLKVSSWPSFNTYYVEIATKDLKKMYGTLEALEATKLTTLTTVRVDLTQEILDKVMDNQVSQVTVSDPTEQKIIIRLTIGNRMPPEMQAAYDKKGITRY